MKIEERVTRICPICGKEYDEYPALSRADGLTPICPDCGVMEALSSIDISDEEQEKIISIIHSAGRRENGQTS